MDARESLAFEAVRQELRIKPQQLTDLRSRRGIGADAIDELGEITRNQNGIGRGGPGSHYAPPIGS